MHLAARRSLWLLSTLAAALAAASPAAAADLGGAPQVPASTPAAPRAPQAAGAARAETSPWAVERPSAVPVDAWVPVVRSRAEPRAPVAADADESSGALSEAVLCGGPCDAAPACDPCAWRPRVEVWGRYSYVRPSGRTFITRGGAPGSATWIDVQDDLSMDWGNAFEAGVAVRVYGRHRVWAAYERLMFSGTSTLDAPVVFHAVTYPAGERVESDLDIDFWKAGYEYAWLERPAVVSRVGVGGWFWGFDQKLKGTTSNLDESRSFSHAMPIAQVTAEGNWGLVHAQARVAGGLLASDRYVLDVAAGAGVRIAGRVDVDLGWRWTRLAFHETTNKAELDFTGPYLEVSVDF